MMIVNTGLMARVRNEAQLAAVLGHEAGHYYRKHSIERYRSLRNKTATMAWVGAIANLGAGLYSVGPYSSADWIYAAQGINTLVTMSMFQMSRTQEEEADAYGISLMARSGYTPDAASQVWKQLIEERKASAAQRDKRYRDRSASLVSTRPPTEDRMKDLADTAAFLAKRSDQHSIDRRDEFLAAVAPHRAMLLEEQIKLNDPGASLYLVNSLAEDGLERAVALQRRRDLPNARRNRGSRKSRGGLCGSYRFHGRAPRGLACPWIRAAQGQESRRWSLRPESLPRDESGAKDAGVVRYTLTQ